MATPQDIRILIETLIENTYNKSIQDNNTQLFVDFLNDNPEYKIYVKKIKVSDNNSSIISTLPNLQTLNCSLCYKLDTIPFLSKLETLICHNSYVSSIPELPLLTTLDCSYCDIIFLPNLPNLETLNCERSMRIIKIPYYPKLITLKCGLCTSLRDIPSMPNLITLDCSECECIISLPEFPNLTSLDHECCSCLSNINIPKYPKLIKNGAFSAN